MGYKVVSSYAYNCHVYLGKEHGNPESNLACCVVRDLSRTVEGNSQHLNMDIIVLVPDNIVI